MEAVDTAGVVEAQPGQQGRQEEEAEGAEETSGQAQQDICYGADTEIGNILGFNQQQ